MRDDGNMIPNGHNIQPHQYWTEEQWESFLLENEKLMDRYQQVIEENPEREWEDPTDLFLKVHHGIDLGEEVRACNDANDKKQETAENQDASLDVAEQADDLEELDFEEDPLYLLAFELGMEVMEWVKSSDVAQRHEEEARIKELCFHSLKIAADIAGGFGIGHDEDGLCGNIVKHRWALSHAKECSKHLLSIRKKFPDTEALLAPLQTRFGELQNELEKQIDKLRNRVWW